MRTSLVVLFYFLLPLAPSAFAGIICPTVIQENSLNLKLADSEKRLICGDQDQSTIQGKTWAYIPPNQAQLHLTAMLESRGYQNPSFRAVNGILYFDPGSLSHITSITVTGAPKEFHIERKRKMVGELLTPSKLNELEHWSAQELRENSHPCPKVKTTADKKTGQVALILEPGPRQTVIGITEDVVPVLQLGALRRYDAFQIGGDFNIRDITLTERRILGEDILASTHLETRCLDQGAQLHHAIVEGPPRLFRAGFGVNTEQGFLGKFTWRHSRVDQNASIIETSLTAGFKRQEFDASYRWYYRPAPTRRFLRPNLQIIREDEQTYRSESAIMSLFVGTAIDDADARYEGQAGPSWRFDRTLVGVGPAAARSLELDIRGQITSHVFEYYSSHPQEGFRLSVAGAFSNKAFASTFTGQKVLLTGEYLWNYRKYNPPLWVFGVRGGYGTTLTDVALEENTELPTAFRYFLGGSQDLRGFNRKDLPGSSAGALTEAYLDLEARFCDLPYMIQPFVFTDFGEMSARALSLNQPLYWSPGLGVRWDSPIGVIRTTAGYGFVSPLEGAESHSHWQFYLGYGEEF